MAEARSKLIKATCKSDLSSTEDDFIKIRRKQKLKSHSLSPIGKSKKLSKEENKFCNQKLAQSENRPPRYIPIKYKGIIENCIFMSNRVILKIYLIIINIHFIVKSSSFFF